MKPVALFFALMLSFLVGLHTAFNQSPAEQVQAPNYTLRMTFQLRNKSSLPQRDVLFFAHLPNMTSDMLVSLSPQSEAPVEYLNQGHGARIQLMDFAPFEKRLVTLSANGDWSGKVSFSRSLAQFDLVSNKDSAILKQLAEQLERATLRESIRSVHQWVQLNVDLNRYNKYLKAPHRVIQELQGDCTDVAWLAKVLLSMMGYDSVMVGGYQVDNPVSLLSSDQYHNWLYVFDEARDVWVLFDPFSSSTHQASYRYLPFSVADNTGFVPRFSVANDNIEIRMQ